MARLPTKDDLGPLPSARTGRALVRPDIASPSPGAAAAVGQSAANFGKTLAAFGGRLSESADHADEFETERRFQEFKWNEAKALDERMRSTEPGQAGGLPDTWATEYQERAKDFFKSVPPSLKPKYDLKLFDAERGYYGDAAVFARNEQKRFSVASIEDNRDRLASSGDLDSARADYEALLEANPYLSPIEKDQQRRKDLDQLETANIEWRLSRGDDLEEILRDLQNYGGDKPPRKLGTVETHDDGYATVSTGTSGAKFRVSGQYADRFAGLLADLESAGVDIKGDQSGGYNDRPIAGTRMKSQHGFGRAVDINWSENARGTRGKIDRDLAMSLAKKWGMKWGGTWKNPDPMHFEIDRSAKWEPPAESGLSSEAETVPPSVSERGMTQYAGMERKGTKNDAGGTERARLPMYPNISPSRRSALIFKARTALSERTQRDIDDDIERLRRTGEVSADTTGRTSLDRARGLLTPNQLTQKEIKWREAQMEFNALAPLPDMSEDEALEHLRQLVPDASLKGDSYASAVKVEERANREWQKIKELRAKDPAAAVDDLMEVQQAKAKVAQQAEMDASAPEQGGTLYAENRATPQQGRQELIEARKAVQRRLGMKEWEIRPITAAEAKELLDMPEPSSMEPKAYIDGLRAAAARADEVYGPEYAEEVMKAAISFTRRDKEEKEISAGIIAKMARGQPVQESEFRKASELTDIDRIGRVFDGQGLEEERPAIAQQPGAIEFGAQAQSAGPGRQVTVTPKPVHTEWLMVDPQARAAAFDRMFGPGAAAKVIGQANKKPPAKTGGSKAQ